jgi:hypothetical protein
MLLLKPRAERQLKRNLGGELSPLSWQFPYRSPLIRCRSATAINLHRTHSLRSQFHRQPAKHTLSCSTMGHSVERQYLYRRETEHSRQKLKKVEKIAVIILIVGLRRSFTFKNLRNMRLVSMEMNRIGNCSIVYVTERDNRELEAPSSVDPAAHFHGKNGWVSWKSRMQSEV